MGKAGSKSRMISICSNDIHAEIYNAVICVIYTLLYGIKIGTKFSKIFCCRESRICGDDIGEAKYLPFSQVEMLPLEILKK